MGTENATEPQAPPVYFATEPYVEKIMTQTHNILAEAIHEQTRQVSAGLQDVRRDLHEETQRMRTQFNEQFQSQTRWLVGLLVGLTLALVLAVLINPLLHGG